jgi:hypothetical protein
MVAAGKFCEPFIFTEHRDFMGIKSASADPARCMQWVLSSRACDHTYFFHNVDGNFIGDCGCVSPGIDCSSASNQVFHPNRALYKVLANDDRLRFVGAVNGALVPGRAMTQVFWNNVAGIMAWETALTENQIEKVFLDTQALVSASLKVTFEGTYPVSEGYSTILPNTEFTQFRTVYNATQPVMTIKFGTPVCSTVALEEVSISRLTGCLVESEFF